jgi:cytidine deaminase
MKHGTVTITFTEHASSDALSAADQQLVRDAHDAALRAYAPYSRFKVGAALRMGDGRTVTGNNQENRRVSVPSGPPCTPPCPPRSMAGWR